MRALILVLVACGSSAPPPPSKPAPPASPAPPATNEETFTGTLTEVSFRCAADASCDLVVDGTKRVHFGHDTRLEGETQWGNTEEIFALMEDPKQGVGRRVEVFAAKTGEGSYTLQGRAAYYIKVLP